MSLNLIVKLKESLPGWKSRMAQWSVDSAYAVIAASAIWPLVLAAQADDVSSGAALAVAFGGNVASNLVADKIMKWRTQADAARDIAALPKDDPARNPLDVLLQNTDAFALAREALPAEDRRWFQETLREELARLGNLGKFEVQIGHISVGNIQISLGTPPAPKLSDDQVLRFFAGYLGGVAEDCSKLVTRGISLGGDPHQKPLRLAHVYVDLQTETPNPLAKKDDARFRGAEPESRLSALEILFDPKAQRVVLTGEPGSGKSTFLQYVTLCLGDSICAPQGQESHLAGLAVPELLQKQKLAPLRILLREFAPTITAGAKGESRQVEEFLRTQVGQEAAPYLNELLKRGLAFVLFDGLDEVPRPQLAAVKQAIEAFAKVDFRKCRAAVTCRIESYKREEFKIEGFPAPHRIAPLSSAHRARFVQAWYRELEEVQPQFNGEGAACAASLLSALATDRLRDMAGNPFFLTAMAALHRPDDPLPDTSAKLMDKLVTGVLEESRKRGFGSDSKRDETELACLLKDVRDGFNLLRLRLEAIAYAAREKRQDQSSRYVDEDLLRARLQLDKSVSGEWVDKLLEALLHRAGLLQSQDGRNFEFAYRFEEFLAGCRLANRDVWAGAQSSFVTRARGLLEKQGDYARQVVIWAAGINAHLRPERSSVREMVSDLTRRSQGKDAAALERLELAAEIACDAHMEHWQDEDVPDTSDTVERLRARLEAVRDGVSKFKVAARSRAASAIGRLGDPRPGVGLVKETKLPGIVFGGLIPAGKFKLGETGAEMVIERSYRLARYPVTVAQFQAFVAGGGYADDGSPEAAARLGRWWTPECLVWKRENEISGPENYAPVFQTPNHPRVGVSWFEAVAFCRWLSEKTGSVIRLPREVEWERAARGLEGREYPWGGDGDLPRRCNMDKTGLESTSAVGLFTLGDTPAEGGVELGLADMAGNVWEWCQTKWREDTKPRDVADNEKLEGDDAPALRGGSWGNSARVCRSASRFRYRPDVRYWIFGFRVCLVPGPRAQPD